MKLTLRLLWLSGVLLLSFSCHSSINKNIEIKDGEHRRGTLNTINGTIKIGSHCTIDGDCHTINGSIQVGAHSHVGHLAAINGNINLAEKVMSQSIKTINGTIETKPGAFIEGNCSTINGKMILQGTRVVGNISTHNGDIELTGASRVKGDIIVRKSREKKFGERFRTIHIHIADGSVVEGDVRVADRSDRVKLMIAVDAKVLGEIIHTKAIFEN